MKEYKDLFDIPQGSVVEYSEFHLDRHENRKLTNRLEGVLQTVIKPYERLDRTMLEFYYGTELSNEDYLQLSSTTGVRLVVNSGLNEYGEPINNIIEVNEAFYTLGLQVVKVESTSPVGQNYNLIENLKNNW